MDDLLLLEAYNSDFYQCLSILKNFETHLHGDIFCCIGVY